MSKENITHDRNKEKKQFLKQNVTNFEVSRVLYQYLHVDICCH
jgi:hypothetical protein